MVLHIILVSIGIEWGAAVRSKVSLMLWLRLQMLDEHESIYQYEFMNELSTEFRYILINRQKKLMQIETVERK